ncbi:aminotransferase class I and II [Desulfatibacillum aliphaticivorans]|uniref:cysteine-S-conjugate beta-lyase n=1 Tax=Desulfatibacillum aliphaticivorans TaxID=218208 RepID=B8FCI4_DESAL|nr:MalY/PatB family protein [Desulfatibacillum aliphaticivorans]ACL06147.1 aminotransferase class I and II [Desulfatibacillum aliphaticivorans]
MPYDFDRIIDRRGTQCEKWDGMEEHYGVSPGDGISMWVADMEFRPPPAVAQAFKWEMEHGVHGYWADSGQYKQAIVNWMARRHNWSIEPSWISTTHGIVMAVNMLVQAFCKPGDKVIIQTPVYYPFAFAVAANGCQVINNRLVKENGRYVMDLDDLKRQADGQTRMIILCSPHNPGGRVWSKEELEALAEICLSRNILMVSDEIHHDLVYPGAKHTVLASLSPELQDKVVVCTSASKTFNLAGTMTGNVIIANEELRKQFTDHLYKCGMFLPNRFGPIAARAAYNHGEGWLDALLLYLEENRNLIASVLENRLPAVKSMPLEGTYLAWLDFSGMDAPMDEIVRKVEKEARLALNHGDTFGPGGENHLRMNFACPRLMVEQALERLIKAFV